MMASTCKHSVTLSLERSKTGNHRPSQTQSELIADIAQLLIDRKVRIAEILGATGTGKSFVAEKIAHRLRESYPGSYHSFKSSSFKKAEVGRELHVCIVQLKRHVSIQEIIHDISSQLDFQDFKSNALMVLSVLHRLKLKEQVLFIFENVEALAFPHYDAKSELVGQFLDFCNNLASQCKNVWLILTSQIQLNISVRNQKTVERRTLVAFTKGESEELVRSVWGSHEGLSHEVCSEVARQSAGSPRRIIEIVSRMREAKQDREIRRDRQFSSVHVTSDATTRDSHITDLIMILNDIGRKQRTDLVVLAYFPGSFSPEAATALLGGEKTAFVKHDVLAPLSNTNLISTKNEPMQRFTIQPFLRLFLEEIYLLYQNSDPKVRNRFCIFFAHLFKQMTHMELVDRCGESFSLFNMEIENLQKLLMEAVHCFDENFELFFDIAYNAEYYIINLLPKRESVDFYEAICATARRHSPRQYGIMLSSLGQVLGFAQTRLAEAYQIYMKALDYLRPLGESTDLAWLYSHIGFVWHSSGKNGKAERYFNLALRMLDRQNNRLSIQEQRYSHVPQRQAGLRQARVQLDRTRGSVRSSIALLYNTQGKYEESIKCHEEVIEIRKKMFGLHPSIGQTYNNLCLVYDRMGNRTKALEYAKKGLYIKKMFVTQPSNTVLVSLLNVALFTHIYEDNTDKALSYLTEAYDIRKSLGLRHRLTGVIETYRGDMQSHSKHWREALDSFTTALYWYRETEASLQCIVEVLHKAGVALKHLDRFDEAKSRFEESLRIKEALVKEGQCTGDPAVNLRETVKELEHLKLKRAAHLHQLSASAQGTVEEGYR